MSKPRTRSRAQFKVHVALEAANGLQTIHERASEHGVHPTQVSEWKRQLLEGGKPQFPPRGGRPPAKA